MKKYNFTTKQVIDYINDYVEHDDKLVMITEDELFEVLGVTKDELFDDDEYRREDVVITFDGDTSFVEFGDLIGKAETAISEKFQTTFGGNWTSHWMEGVIGVWDEDKLTTEEVWKV